MSEASESNLYGEKLQQIGVELHIIGPLNANDEYGGFLVLTGPEQKVADLVVAFTANAYRPFTQKNIERQIRIRMARADTNTTDFDMVTSTGETRMVRMIPSKTPSGSIRVQLGGGGNFTRLEEMQEGLNFAIDRVLDSSSK